MHSPEAAGLAGGFEDALPEVAVGVDLVALADGEGHGDVDEAATGAADEGFGAAGHGGVDGIVGEADAVDAVVRVGGTLRMA